jgi:hypothetical protein
LKATIATALDQEGKIEFYEEKEKVSYAKFNVEAKSIQKLRCNVQDHGKNPSRCACTSTYGIDEDVKEIGSSSLCAGELSGLRRQPKKNISTNSSSTMACYARGLVVVYSRKLSAMLGGSTSTRP